MQKKNRVNMAEQIYKPCDGKSLYVVEYCNSCAKTKNKTCIPIKFRCLNLTNGATKKLRNEIPLDCVVSLTPKPVNYTRKTLDSTDQSECYEPATSTQIRIMKPPASRMGPGKNN